MSDCLFQVTLRVERGQGSRSRRYNTCRIALVFWIWFGNSIEVSAGKASNGEPSSGLSVGSTMGATMVVGGIDVSRVVGASVTETGEVPQAAISNNNAALKMLLFIPFSLHQ